eukprot:GHVP01007486.1.p1 GENE.GHVP01007486.1~~GHVP01007486.1.p1  ORF type:complete len:263 (-),score=38.43 GHVP01007486.1:336-1034(-)
MKNDDDTGDAIGRNFSDGVVYGSQKMQDIRKHDSIDIPSNYRNKNEKANSSISSKAKGSKQINLLTLTFMNPEYDLCEFVNEDFPFLYQYCRNVSIFADAKDMVLRVGELSNKYWFCNGEYQALGRSVFGLKSSKVQESPRKFRSMDTLELCEKEKEDWLDLDVIDTTFTDSNVHAMRHSFWNLNRNITEDVREIITARKRARQRKGRLDRCEGNVWVYRVAPSYVTSVFDS